jgi:hypothetical protein
LVLVLSCDDVPNNPLPATGDQAGIDVGVVTFATLSDGTAVTNPRWARQEAARLEAAQQRLQRARRGSNNRFARRETVAARHRKIANRRKDFHHKQARELAARYDLLVVEDLTIANMLRRAKPKPDPANPEQFLANGARAKSGLNRSISDNWLGSVRLDTARQSGRRWAHVDRGQPPAHLQQVRVLWSRSTREPRQPGGIRLPTLRLQRTGRRTRRTQHTQGRTGPTRRNRSVKEADGFSRRRSHCAPVHTMCDTPPGGYPHRRAVLTRR